MRKACLILLACLLASAGCSDARRIRRGLASPEWQVRYAAAADMHLLCADDETAPLLLGALADPAPRVRNQAARSLVLMLDRGDADALFEQAARQPEPVRRALLGALAERAVPDAAVPFLVRMLSSPSTSERRAAAKAFRRAEAPDKVETLLQVWRRDPDLEVRVAALASAAYPTSTAGKNERLIAAYEDMVAATPDLLRRPPLLAAVGDLRIESAQRHLLAMLYDPQLRYLAIESLGKIGSEAAVPHLLKLLEQDESWVMNRQVCQAIGRIRTAEAGEKLAELFLAAEPARDRDSWDRTAFITLAMVRIGGDAVFEAFVSQLTNEKLRDFALYGLYRMTGTYVVHPENRWLYSWPTIQSKWRRWWKQHKDEVAERLNKQAEEE